MFNNLYVHYQGYNNSGNAASTSATPSSATNNNSNSSQSPSNNNGHTNDTQHGSTTPPTSIAPSVTNPMLSERGKNNIRPQLLQTPNTFFGRNTHSPVPPLSHPGVPTPRTSLGPSSLGLPHPNMHNIQPLQYAQYRQYTQQQQGGTPQQLGQTQLQLQLQQQHSGSSTNAHLVYANLLQPSEIQQLDPSKLQSISQQQQQYTQQQQQFIQHLQYTQQQQATSQQQQSLKQQQQPEHIQPQQLQQDLQLRHEQQLKQQSQNQLHFQQFQQQQGQQHGERNSPQGSPVQGDANVKVKKPRKPRMTKKQKQLEEQQKLAEQLQFQLVHEQQQRQQKEDFIKTQQQYHFDADGKKKRGRPKKLILDPETNTYIDSTHPNFKHLNKVLKDATDGGLSKAHQKELKQQRKQLQQQQAQQQAQAQAQAQQAQQQQQPKKRGRKPNSAKAHIDNEGIPASLSKLFEQPPSMRNLGDEAVQQLLKKKDRRGRPRKFPVEETGVTIKGIRINGNKINKK